MTVNGGGLTVNTIAYVGEFGTGTLNLNSGAVVNVFDMAVGSDVTAADEANGTVNVNGTGTFLTASDSILVGQGATEGHIFVDEGGVLTSPETNIGEDEASTGTIKFTNGSFGALGNTYVGLNGNGTLEIDESSVTATAVYVGYADTSTGFVSISGANGYLTDSGDLYVGQYSEAGGTLQISGGANLEAANIYIGENTGTGTFTITGLSDEDNNPLGSASADGTLSVGGSGTGIMEMSQGAQFTSSYTVVGRDSDGIGTLTLIGNIEDGPPTQFTTGDLEVGYEGIGNVSVTESGIGGLNIDGSRSVVNVSGSASVGNQGTGMVTITNSGNLTTDDADIAVAAGSMGSVSVDGSGSYWLNDALNVADSGTGSLMITNAATVTSITGDVGVNSGGSGTVTIDGAGSAWNIIGSLTVGDEGNAALTVSGGAAMYTADAWVAKNAGSTASVTLSGDGSLWHSIGSLYIGGSSTLAGGAGTVTVDTGASLDVDGTLELWNSGKLDIAGGSVTAATLDLEGGTLTFSNGGQLNVPGAMTLHNHSRVNLNAGTTSVGGLSISGNSGVNVNAALAVNYGSPAKDPVSAIVSYLQSSYNGGNWTGTSGIVSTSAAAGTTPLLSVGYADGNIDTGTAAAPNQVLIKLTLAGDANLDGNVDFNDLFAVGKRLNTTGNDWANGNFNYSPNGAVDFNDLFFIGQNLDKTINGAGVVLGGTTLALGQSVSIGNTAVSVPEPSAIGVAAVAAIGLLARRRRSKNSPLASEL
jgi:T5SS/PEP-CTERM-associated repeat protein